MSDSNEAISIGRLFNVNGMIAVITGGGTGIGSYMARALAVNGADKVFIVGRREQPLQTVAASVTTKNIIPIAGDVTSKESLQHIVEAIKSHGVAHIDVLICNAGITGPPAPLFGPAREVLAFEELVNNLWKPEVNAVTATYNMNLSAVYFCTAAFLPMMGEANKQRPQPPTSASNARPHPQIIVTGSISGFNRMPLENLSYGPSKAGVVHMVKQLATVLAPYDIRANLVAPGFFLSELTQSMVSSSDSSLPFDVEGAWSKDMIPAGRFGNEEDMAGTIVWLCSRAGAYVNGNIVVLDGGRLSQTPASY